MGIFHQQGKTSMAIDPLSAGAAVASGLSAIFGGGDKTKNQVREQKREFDISQSPGIGRLIETSGLRDKLLSIFGQSAGAVPQRFQARDMFNPDRSAGPSPIGGGLNSAGAPPPGGQGVSAIPFHPQPNPNALPMTYGAAPQQGGVDPSTLGVPQNYKMGDGGVNVELYKDLLRRLGYNGPGSGAPPAPAPGANPNGPGGGWLPWQVPNGPTPTPWNGVNQGNVPGPGWKR